MTITRQLRGRILIIIALLVCSSVVALIWHSLQAQDVTTALLAQCADESQKKEICYSEAFEAFAEKHGPIAAFNTLTELQKIDEDAHGCHFIAHGIGYGTYKRNPKNWQEDFRNIDQACTYGAMHGILEKHIAQSEDGITIENISSFCGDNPRSDCNHIIGHLTLLETSGRIPEALVLCDGLPRGGQQRFCQSGIFMEHITAFNLISHGFADNSWLNWPARLPDIKELCRKQTGTAADACWIESAHAVAVKEADDPARVFQSCNTNAPSEQASDECRRHAIGIMLGGPKFNFNLKKARPICNTLPGEDIFHTECHASIVTSFLSTTPHRLDEAVLFCTETTGDENKRACFSGIGNVVNGNQLYTPDKIARACAVAEEPLRELCEKGGTATVGFSSFYHPEEL